MFEILFDIIGALLSPFISLLGDLFIYVLLPVLGIAVVCGLVYVLFCKINPPPLPKETVPPNLRSGTESGRQCKDCFYCGRNMSDSGEGLAHLCTKHNTTVSKYSVCDDFKSYIDAALGI